jgi:tRNA U34 5-carboxymethylaminomethyl modifying GTPase MnmE/TrmE
MADHTQMSWKNESVITQLNNSVDHVALAVEKAQSHPTQQLIQQAQNALEHADNALNHALQNSEHQEPVNRLQEQLNQNKERLEQLRPAED